MIRGVVSQIKALQEGTGPAPYQDQVETLLAGAKEFKGEKLYNSSQLIQSFQKGYKEFLASILAQMEKRVCC